MVARVGKHDATRPVAERQSSSRRRNDRCAVDDEAETIRADALMPRPARHAAGAGLRQRTRYVPRQGIAALGLRPPLTR